MGVSPMIKARVWQLLAARGATKAVVEFSGGNDEGGTDSITLITPLADPNLEPATIGLVIWYGGYNGIEPTNEDQELSGLLQGPIDDEYGSFGGDFHVDGTLTWDRIAGTVKMEKTETVDSYETSEEEL